MKYGWFLFTKIGSTERENPIFTHFFNNDDHWQEECERLCVSVFREACLRIFYSAPSFQFASCRKEYFEKKHQKVTKLLIH